MHLFDNTIVFWIEWYRKGLIIIREVMKKILIIGAVISAAAFTGCYFPGPCIQGYGPLMVETRDIENFTAVSNAGSFEVQVTLADTFGVEVEAQENLLEIIETYVSGSTLIVKTKNGLCIGNGAPVVVYVSLPELAELRNTGSGYLYADRADIDEFEITNTGSGKISIDSVFAYSVSVKNSGSGQIHISGFYADDINVSQTGSGIIDAGTIYGAADFNVNHTSSGRIYATLIDLIEVDANLSGSGRIELWGDAEMADYSLSSSGKIDALELLVSTAEATISGSGKIFLHATDFLDVTITGSGDLIYRGRPEITTRITGSGNIRPY